VIVVPYTRLRSLGLGNLTVEDIDVGVDDLLPGAPSVGTEAYGINHPRIAGKTDRQANTASPRDL
jgi:hypothetical protein